MHTVKTRTGGELILAVEGRLDTATAPLLEEELKTDLNGVTDLTLDFEKLAYISSAGLRIMIWALHALPRGGRLRVKHVNEVVREILDITGLSEILDIEA